MSLIMNAEQQYIDLFSQCEAMICRHSAEALNAPGQQLLLISNVRVSYTETREIQIYGCQ